MSVEELKRINATLEVPAKDATTPVREEEARAIYDFIKENKIERTLEIGFAYGRSASHIMAATGKAHMAMDPFQAHYGRKGLANIEKLGFADRLTLHEDFSHNVLPKLHVEGRQFDFIFIDGDHKFDGIFVDYYYSDFLIGEGGYLLFHDTWMRSTQLVLSFIRKNRPDYKEMPFGNGNMALFQKISGQDKRDGMHFREFFTGRSFLRHHATMFFYENPNHPLRKLLKALRRK